MAKQYPFPFTEAIKNQFPEPDGSPRLWERMAPNWTPETGVHLHLAWMKESLHLARCVLAMNNWLDSFDGLLMALRSVEVEDPENMEWFGEALTGALKEMRLIYVRAVEDSLKSEFIDFEHAQQEPTENGDSRFLATK